MLTLSATMQAAMAAGNPQRVLLIFPDGEEETSEHHYPEFTNQDISISAGVRVFWPFNADEELTFGMCPSAEVEFTLLNDEGQITEFDFGECEVWFGYRIDGEPPVGAKTRQYTEDGETVTYEFAPVGVYIVERPDVVQKDMIQIRANDRMSLFDEEMPSQADLGFSDMPSGGVTIKALLQALCTKAGVTLATQNFLNEDLTFTSWPTKYFDGRTMREVLKWIAEAAGSIARFNRLGELELTWFTAVPSSSVTFDESDYKEFTQSWYTTAAIDGLKVRNASETSESSLGTNNNPYVISGNPFLR